VRVSSSLPRVSARGGLRCGTVTCCGVGQAPSPCQLLSPGRGATWLRGGVLPLSRSRPRARSRASILSMADEGGGKAAGGRTLILGAGWVGSRLAKKLVAEGRTVAVTNRPGTQEKVKPLYFRPVTLPDEVTERMVFDLDSRETWESLPPPETFDSVVVTFPLSSAEVVAFWDEYLCRVPHVICYSSTSVYEVTTPGQNVDERTPLKGTLRTNTEETVMERGASVLTISGIFGEPRGPRGVCACLTAYSSAGGNLNAGSSINMVHVQDILEATCRCLHNPRRGERLNVAGAHFQLAELVKHCKHPAIPESLSGPDYNSKIVSSDRLLKEVMPSGYSFVPPM